MAARRRQLPGLIFLGIVVVAIVAMLAGFGVPVGIGALVGLILGLMAGAIGALWLARGPGRSIQLGSYSWASYDTPQTPSVELVAESRELLDILGVDLGPIDSILPVLSTVEADGLTIQLLAIEMHEAGACIGFDVHTRPGSLPPPPMVNVSVTDDVGTRYRALGQGQGGGPGRMRYEVTFIPAVPKASRHLNRGIAVVAGVLFIIATVADLISRVVLVQPVLTDPVDFSKISANEDQVLLGAFFYSSGLLRLLGLPSRSTRS
jgi:hypothetical protein